MKIQVRELNGAALNWAVARCEWFHQMNNWEGTCSANYIADWAHSGPIIEREEITIMRVWKDFPLPWCAEIGEDGSTFVNAPTPLVAAMRSYVIRMAAEEIVIPEGISCCDYTRS